MHVRLHSALRVVLLSALAGAALPLAYAADPAKPAEAAKTSESGKTHAVTKLGVKLVLVGLQVGNRVQDLFFGQACHAG